jgi:D-alanyl-D-alanine carboxypeptidase (penicillin-binding protein 5/6)
MNRFSPFKPASLKSFLSLALCVVALPLLAEAADKPAAAPTPTPVAASPTPAVSTIAPMAPSAAPGSSATGTSSPANLIIPQAPILAAKSWLLLNVTSNQILTVGNPDARIEPASLTKLMTAYLSFKALRQKSIALNTVVAVSPKAWKAEGSRMFIEPNRPVTVDELLHGMIIQSGNDASIALAERVGTSEEQFAQMMNQQAAALGMTNTHFMNATGLPDPQHFSTARDLSKIARAIQHDFPEYYPLYSEKQYRYNNINQPNRNHLLWKDPSVDGMKTGHTDSAGFCLIASAKRGDQRLLSVVVGTDSESARAAESEKLLNYGFQYFDTQRIHVAHAVMTKLPVYKAHSDLLEVGFREDLWLTLPKGDFARYKEVFRPKAPLVAPIAAGASVGTLDIVVDGKVVANFEAPSLIEVPTGNILQRFWGSLRLMMP